MIYDKIDNWQTYAAISQDIRLGLDYLRNMTPDVAPGVYELSPRVKAIVSEYTTKKENENGYEAHRDWIDIQYLLSGEETVHCLPLEYLSETQPYDAAKDAAFYRAAPSVPSAGSHPQNNLRISALSARHNASVSFYPPQQLRLGNGYFTILFPQDGHMPCLSVTEPQPVRKVVVKVKI